MVEPRGVGIGGESEEEIPEPKTKDIQLVAHLDEEEEEYKRCKHSSQCQTYVKKDWRSKRRE